MSAWQLKPLSRQMAIVSCGLALTCLTLASSVMANDTIGYQKTFVPANLPDQFRNDVVSLDKKSFAQLVLLRNPDVLITQAQRDIAQQQLRFDQGAYETEFFANLRASDKQTDNRGSIRTDVPLLINRQSGFDFGVRKLVRSGAEITVDYQGIRTSDNTPTSLDLGLQDSKGALNFSIRQPLMRGIGAAQVEGRIAQAEIQIAVSEKEIRQQLLSKTFDALSLYWRLYREEQILTLNTNSLSNARKILADTERMVNAGRLPQTALTEAKSMVVLREAESFSIQQGYTQVTNAIMSLLNIPSSEQIIRFETQSEPDTSAWILPESFDDYYEQVLKTWPNYEIAQQRIAIEQQGLLMAQDELKPRLDLVMGYGQTGRRYQTKSFGGPFNDSFKDDYPNWNMALELSMPIGGNESARARQEIALTRIAQNQLQADAVRVELANQLSTRLQQVTQSHEEMKRHAENVQMLSELLTIERDRYDRGMSRLMDVIDREDNYNMAVVRLLDSQIRFELAKATLQLSDGSLLNDLNINFDVDLL
ncbi:MAG: TolC family protein [Oceanospirillales bacterium]|nr:MAG: TolC family protein [Oceanospirillales bacterium]